MAKKSEFSKLFQLGSKKYYSQATYKSFREGSSGKSKAIFKNEPEEFIRYLAYLRIQNGITQEELAKRLKTQQPYISYFENGHDNPTMDFLKRYCQAIGVKFSIKITNSNK